MVGVASPEAVFHSDHDNACGDERFGDPAVHLVDVKGGKGEGDGVGQGEGCDLGQQRPEAMTEEKEADNEQDMVKSIGKDVAESEPQEAPESGTLICRSRGAGVRCRPGSPVPVYLRHRGIPLRCCFCGGLCPLRLVELEMESRQGNGDRPASFAGKEHLTPPMRLAPGSDGAENQACGSVRSEKDFKEFATGR